MNMNEDKIKATIETLYSRVFNQGQVDLLADLVAGEYIQHNPLFSNGTAPLAGYLKQAGSLPCEVKRMAIDGDLAFIHVRYLDWGGREHAAVDIFRFDSDGKIVEHWDVIEPIAPQSEWKNTNGKF